MPRHESEASRIARLTAEAQGVLGDRSLAYDRMHTPNRGLGGDTPAARAKTAAGAREVEDLLGRIAHGVVS